MISGKSDLKKHSEEPLNRKQSSYCDAGINRLDVHAGLDADGLDIERILNKVMQLILREIDRKEA